MNMWEIRPSEWVFFSFFFNFLCLYRSYCPHCQNFGVVFLCVIWFWKEEEGGTETSIIITQPKDFRTSRQWTSSETHGQSPIRLLTGQWAYAGLAVGFRRWSVIFSISFSPVDSLLTPKWFVSICTNGLSLLNVLNVVSCCTTFSRFYIMYIQNNFKDASINVYITLNFGIIYTFF